MGSGDSRLAFGRPPTVILMTGLQGSGKTTTSAKLARQLVKQGSSLLSDIQADFAQALHQAQFERFARVEELSFHQISQGDLHGNVHRGGGVGA